MSSACIWSLEEFDDGESGVHVELLEFIENYMQLDVVMLLLSEQQQKNQIHVLVSHEAQCTMSSIDLHVCTTASEMQKDHYVYQTVVFTHFTQGLEKA